MFDIIVTACVPKVWVEKLFDNQLLNAINNISVNYGDVMYIKIISTVGKEIREFDNLLDASDFINKNRELEHQNFYPKKVLMMRIPIVHSIDTSQVNQLLLNVAATCQRLNWNFCQLYSLNTWEIILPDRNIISGYENIKRFV